MSYFSVSLLSDPNPKASLSSLTFRCLVFFAVAAAQGSFAKARQTDQRELVAVIEEIDGALLKKVNTDEVLNLILRKALQLTNSEMGHLRLVDPYRKDMRIVAIIGHPEGPEWVPGCKRNVAVVGPSRDACARRNFQSGILFNYPHC